MQNCRIYSCNKTVAVHFGENSNRHLNLFSLFLPFLFHQQVHGSVVSLLPEKMFYLNSGCDEIASDQ